MGIFDNNLINTVVLFGLLAFLWNKIMPGQFADRKQRIQSALDEAAKAKQAGQDFLETQKQRINNAEKEAEQILVEAKEVAERMKQEIADQTKKDAVDLEHKLTQQIETQRQMVITELRSLSATVAVRLAEASLPGTITPAVKQGLQDQFLTQLDTIGNTK